MAKFHILLLLFATFADHPRILHVEGHPLTNKDSSDVASTTEIYDELTTILSDVKNNSTTVDSSIALDTSR